MLARAGRSGRFAAACALIGLALAEVHIPVLADLPKSPRRQGLRELECVGMSDQPASSSQENPAIDAAHLLEPYAVDVDPSRLGLDFSDPGSSERLAGIVDQLDPELEDAICTLVDSCNQQELLVRHAIYLAERRGVRESLLQRLNLQLRYVEHGRAELLNVLSRVLSVGMLGSQLIAALKQQGWIVKEAASAPANERRRGFRYRPVRPLVENASWVQGAEAFELLDVEVLSIDYSGLSMLCNKPMPVGAQVMMPFRLPSYQAVTRLRTMWCVPAGGRFRIGALFTHI